MAHYFLRFQDQQRSLHLALNRVIQMGYRSHNQHLPFNKHRWQPRASTGHWGLISGQDLQARRSQSLGGFWEESGNAGWQAQGESGRKVFYGPSGPSDKRNWLNHSPCNKAWVGPTCLLSSERSLQVSSTGRRLRFHYVFHNSLYFIRCRWPSLGKCIALLTITLKGCMLKVSFCLSRNSIFLS